MKKIFLVMLLMLGLVASYSLASTPLFTAGSTLKLVMDNSDKGIEFFQGSWEDAKALALKKKKLIFLDAYAVWCGPCKLMTKKTFSNDEVGKFFNKHFINYKMDMENHPEGSRLADKYGLKAYPTLYFLDFNEEIIHEALGYYAPKDFLDLGLEVVEKTK